MKLLKKNISCIHLKKQLHKIKVLIFKLLNDIYLVKVLQMKYYSRAVVFLYCRICIEGMLIIQSVFYNKLCWNTYVKVLKFKIYEIATWAIGYLRHKLFLKNNDLLLNNKIINR